MYHHVHLLGSGDLLHVADVFAHNLGILRNRVGTCQWRKPVASFHHSRHLPIAHGIPMQAETAGRQIAIRAQVIAPGKFPIGIEAMHQYHWTRGDG